MTTWATVENVELYTGVSVTETSVLRAEADISMFVGITPAGYDSDYANDNDAYYLMLATSWQATRYGNNEDDTFRFDITSTSQDGFSVNLTETGTVLHPKAKWAINQLSWAKAKTVGGSRSGYGDYFNNVCVSGPIGWRKLP